MINIATTLGFGLLLGVKHAFEADHLIAVSTILAEQKSTKRAALVGTFWGIGHTTTLFVIGLVVLIFSLSIPENVAEHLELLVGIMLIVLGVQSILKKPNTSKHEHEHEHTHDTITHSHIHKNHIHRHGKSFLIGSIHGLAGSGAMMVLVLSLITSVWEGILYILLFGIGSTISMTFMSLFIGIPFSKSMALFSRTERIIRIVMGTVSIGFGLFIILSSL